MRLGGAKHKAKKIINAVQQEFNEFIIMNGRSINRHSASRICDSLLGRNERVESCLIDYIDNYYASAVANNNTLAKDTKKTYAKATRQLKIFWQKKAAHYFVQDLTPTPAGEFKDYLPCVEYLCFQLTPFLMHTNGEIE